MLSNIYVSVCCLRENQEKQQQKKDLLFPPWALSLFKQQILRKHQHQHTNTHTQRNASAREPGLIGTPTIRGHNLPHILLSITQSNTSNIHLHDNAKTQFPLSVQQNMFENA